MGYSAWKWTLLLLCAGVMLGCGGMLAYTAVLGVERVQTAVVELH